MEVNIVLLMQGYILDRHTYLAVHSGVGEADGVGVAPIVSALTLLIAPKVSNTETAKTVIDTFFTAAPISAN